MRYTRTWITAIVVTTTAILLHVPESTVHSRAVLKPLPQVGMQQQGSATASQPTPQLERAAQPATTPGSVAPKAATPRKPKAAPQSSKPAAPAPAPSDPWMATFNRIASSQPGEWHVGDAGAWGATCLRASGLCTHAGQVFIARRTPLNKLASVMYHESIHVRQYRIYGTNLIVALAPFGGIEAVADCGARMLGATWTGYVRTCTPEMNHAAQAMLQGVKA